MTTLGPLDIDFDLGSTFPRCIREYNDVKIKINDPYRNEFSTVCYIIKNSILKSRNMGYNFYNSCIYLSNYLEGIKDKTEEERIPYCKYFYFKLKDEINDLNSSCKGETECYKEMISAGSNIVNAKNVPDSCKGLINDLDADIFSLFQMLEGLYYKNTYKLLTENEECQQSNPCFTNYKQLCETCRNGNNEKLRIFLEKYKDEHLKYLNGVPSCIESPNFIYSTSGTSVRTVLLTSFIITLAIPFITFILYEVN